MAKSLDIEIQKYLPLLGNEEKKSILSVIKSFLHLKKEESHPFDRVQYNKDIDQSLADIDSGNYISQEELEKEMEQW